MNSDSYGNCTVNSMKYVIMAFLYGFIDSLRGAVDLFVLDFQSSKNKQKKIFQRNFQKERLLTRDCSTNNLQNQTEKIPLEHRYHSEQKSSFNFLGEPNILERTMKCCALNGCLFWLSIVAFERLFLPMIRSCLLIALGGSQELADNLWHWFLPILSLTFSTLWVLPFFLLCKIVNAIWFQDIADSAFRFSQGRPRIMSSLSMMIADTIFSIVVESIFLMQAKVFSMLPITIIGYVGYLTHLSLLNSLYCFEYKWFNQGLGLHLRLSFIETNWPYFLGFGMPLALVTTSLQDSLIASGCIFSILFPFFIISGNKAIVVTGSRRDRSEFPPFRIFAPTMSISNALFSKTLLRYT